MDIPHFTAWNRVAQPAGSLDLVRLGLISGAVLVASFSFGALVFVLEPGTVAPENPAERIVTSRTPRPRPSEPVTTGSIAPVRPTAALDLEAAIVATRPRPAESPAAEDLRSRAVLMASASAQCDEVVGSELLAPGSNPADPVVVWVKCRNGASLYLHRHRLEAETAVRPQAVPLTLTDSEAVQACEDQVRLGLPVPASLARRFATTGIERAPGDDPVVSFELDALNGLGFPLALHVQCVFDNARLARLHVDPR